MTQPPPPPVVQPPPPPPPPMTAPPRSGGIPGWAIALIIGGVLLAVLLVIGMMVAIVTPAMGRARNLARMTICQTNLQGIGMAIQIYRADHDAMPPGMDALTQGQYMADASMFKCPCLQSGRKSDYFFHFPPADQKDPDVQTFIACDWKDNHRDGSRNVLSYDGSVWRMRKEQFERELKLPRNAAFAKALREQEGPQPAPARAPEERKPR